MSHEKDRDEGLPGRAAILAGALALVSLAPIPPFLAWNGSPSIREGLYLIEPWARVGNGDLVLAWAPQGARSLASERLYLPRGIPLIKRVAASAGDRVCALGRLVRVNGRRAVERLSLDPSGRTMPWWNGCRKLGRGELLILAPTLRSFDGRYFGVIGERETIGKALPLWAL